MIGVVILLVAILASGTKIQSVDEYYLTHMEDIKKDSETVTISIRCDTVLDNWDKLDPQLRDEKYVPSDGVILPETTYVLRPGDTAFDILNRVCRYNKIQMEYRGLRTMHTAARILRGSIISTSFPAESCPDGCSG